MIGLCIGLFVVALITFGIMWLYTKFVPLQFKQVKIHTCFIRKKLYFIARCGLKCVIEAAAPPAGTVLPLKDGQKMECLIVEGTPKRTFFKPAQNEIQRMQYELMSHIAEFYPWIQVVEVLMPKT